MDCAFDSNITYTIILEDLETNDVAAHIMDNENHCSDGICTTSITLMQSNGNYNFSIFSQNMFGRSDIVVLPFSIGT